jgi:hypothetical protein
VTPLVRMEKILARRFAPFDFSAIPGFPNVVPSPNEWGDYLPRFGKCEGDNPAQHLSEFHELMRQWEIHHEDVLLKMFMFSLAGDARKWYHSLPPASISSLSEFHAAFTAYCQELYPSELIFHSCCEGYYNKCIQDRVVSYVGYEDDPDDLDQKSVISPPHSSASGEVMELVKSITARLDRWEAERCTEDFGISTMDDYEDPGEEEDASGEVMELVKSITARLDRWEAEQCAEDFPSFEAEALSSSTEGDYEQSFPTGPVYGHYESDPWESQEEEILPDMIMSDEGCDDEGCKDRRLGEEDALSELIEQAKSLTAQHARLESEDNGEDFLVSKADVLDGSFKEMIEDFVNALTSAPDELVVSDQNDEEVVMEEDCSLFLHEISHDVFTFGVEMEERGIVPLLQVGEALFPPTLMIIWKRSSGTPHHLFLISAASPLMTVTNQSLSSICWISKSRSQNLVLCSLRKIITRKSAISVFQETLSSTRKSRIYPGRLFMMNTNLTRGRAKKKRKRNQKNS